MVGLDGDVDGVDGWEDLPSPRGSHQSWAKNLQHFRYNFLENVWGRAHQTNS